MLLHPDTPEEVKGDPDLYARWRLDHLDDDEKKPCGLSSEQQLAIYRDEWYGALEDPEEALEWMPTDSQRH
jgi:hypothetical protein